MSNETHPSHQDPQPVEKCHSTLGKDFIDQKIHSRMAPTKIDKKPQNSTLRLKAILQMTNKNEGNAMGNIYSEEAHVVGHLSRHYGDRFETKNISAILRGYQKPDVDQDLPDTTLDKLHTDGIPQEVIDEYIRGLDKISVQERSRNHLTVPPQDYIARSKKLVPTETIPRTKSTSRIGRSAPTPPRSQAEPIRVPRLHRSKHEVSRWELYDTLYGTAPPFEGRVDPSRGSGTSMPPSAPDLRNFRTSYDQVRALSSYFQNTLLPLCHNYVARLPADNKTRESEHKILSETIMVQVLLQADGISPDSEETRYARRKLVKDAQSALSDIDHALRGYRASRTYAL